MHGKEHSTTYCDNDCLVQRHQCAVLHIFVHYRAAEYMHPFMTIDIMAAP